MPDVSGENNGVLSEEKIDLGHFFFLDAISSKLIKQDIS